MSLPSSKASPCLTLWRLAGLAAEAGATAAGLPVADESEDQDDEEEEKDAGGAAALGTGLKNEFIFALRPAAFSMTVALRLRTFSACMSASESELSLLSLPVLLSLRSSSRLFKSVAVQVEINT